MIAAIVAVDENWGIGKDGDLLLSIPADLKRFKKFTENHTVIMGRKTYESLPNGPLPNRWNIVVTHDPDVINQGRKPINLIAVNHEQVINDVLKNPIFCHDRSIYIIGGSQIYSEFLKYCKRVYVTKIYHSFAADTYFPDLSTSNTWALVEGSKTMEYEGYRYQYLGYLNTKVESL